MGRPRHHEMIGKEHSELFVCLNCGGVTAVNFRDSAHGCPVCHVGATDIGKITFHTMSGPVLFKIEKAPHTETDDDD